MSDETVPSEATTAVTVPEELLPKRGPGRPLGAKNKDRVSSIERINREGDPLGFRLKALRRGWIMAAADEGAKTREKVFLTKDEMLRLSGQLEDKILPRLRSLDVNGVGDVTNNTLLVGALDDLGETQLSALVTALQQAGEERIRQVDAIEVTPKDTANAVVRLRPPGWT